MVIKPKSARKKANAKSTRKRKGRTLKKTKTLQKRILNRDPGEESDIVSAPVTGSQMARKSRQPVDIPVSNDPLEKNCFRKYLFPEGYVFVPKGNVYITRHCRSRTKQSQQVVYAIYHRSGKRTLGIQVPSDIYKSVLDSAAATADSRASAVRLRDEKDQSRARESLREQFPLMPAESLEEIIKHAFLKGSGRVGRTTTKSEERKAILAVEAHIRHVHTPYEEFLRKGMKRQKAREAVWEKVRAIRDTWQGVQDQERTEVPAHDLEVESECEVEDEDGDTVSEISCNSIVSV